MLSRQRLILTLLRHFYFTRRETSVLSNLWNVIFFFCKFSNLLQSHFFFFFCLSSMILNISFKSFETEVGEWIGFTCRNELAGWLAQELVNVFYKRLHHNFSTLALQHKGSPDNMDTLGHDCAPVKLHWRGLWAGSGTWLWTSLPSTNKNICNSLVKLNLTSWATLEIKQKGGWLKRNPSLRKDDKH